MVTTTIVIALMATILVLAGWTIFVFEVPSYTSSMFRYRLWRVRDSIADDVIDGVLSDSKGSQLLISEIENVINQAADVSLFKILLLGKMPSNIQKAIESERTESFRNLPVGEQNKLRAYRKEVYEIILKHCLIGCRSGWLFLVPAVPIATVIVLGNWIGKGMAGGWSVLKEQVVAEATKSKQVSVGMSMLGHVKNDLTPALCS